MHSDPRELVTEMILHDFDRETCTKGVPRDSVSNIERHLSYDEPCTHYVQTLTGSSTRLHDTTKRL